MARESATGFENNAVSNEVGVYTILRLRAASYTVTATATGTTRVLEEISELPLQVAGGSRNALQFMRTLAGVNMDLGQQDIIQTERASIKGSGGYSSPASYHLDGVSGSQNMYGSLRDDSPPLSEIVQEFRVSTNLDAEYGWNGGAGVELILKSGSNQFHGTLFEYFRNDALDARNFFAKSVSPLKQNDFGGVFGGAIIKDKLFFLTSYDGFRLRQAAAGATATVPTSKMRSGDFSEWLGPQVGTDVLGRPVFQNQIYDPGSTKPDGKGGFLRDPFVGNAIPASRISSLSKTFQDSYRNPTGPGLANNWVGSVEPSPVTMDKWTLKIDTELGKNKFSVGVQDIPRKDEVYDGTTYVAPELSNTYWVTTRQYHFQFN